MDLSPLQVGQLQGVARSGAEAHAKLSRLFQQIMLRPLVRGDGIELLHYQRKFGCQSSELRSFKMLRE